MLEKPEPANTQNGKRAMRSLQSQYIIAALLLGSLVLVGTVIGYLNIITTSNQLLQKTESTSRLLDLTTNIREQTGRVYNSVLAIMLDPNKLENRTALDEGLDQSEFVIRNLLSNKLVHQLQLKNKAQDLQKLFVDIRNESIQLLSVRTTPNEQFPALAIASEIMRPLRNDIFTSLNISLLEYREESQLKLNTEEYALLNEALLTWSITISEYRLYLTNRMGSFDPAQLLEQETSVDAHIDLMKNIIQKLTRLSKQDRLGFQSTHMIEKLPQLINQWGDAYQDVKEINHSGEWRSDTIILEQTIIPLMDRISDTLSFMDNKIKLEYQQTLKTQNKASKQQNYILAGIACLFLIYIVISIKLLNHFIIKPIAKMSSAMKDEAYQHKGLLGLNLNRTKETQDLIEAFTEMSHQVFKRQDELEHQAMHDSLTGLPNRLMLHQRLDYHLLITRRERQSLVFMMLDLNRFKEINDTLGHHVGDGLLIQVGERISDLLRSVDTVARLGGDEFAVLLPNTNRDQASHVARSINKSLENTFHVNEFELQISASIGIAEYPSDGEDSHTLMQHADVAMYISKREKSGFHYYSATEDSHSVGRLSLGSDLKAAIENNELSLQFQPKYNVATNSLIGCEALLRWNHKETGPVSPEVVVSIAEDMGIINELSYWVIRNAFETCAQGCNKGYAFSIAINLSVQNLRDPLLIDYIKEQQHKYKLDSSQITFEITESAMMSNPEKSIQVLNRLSKLGVRLSVDDFGTGFSSLAYLKLLPVNELKIDKSFVMDIENDESDMLIVHSTIELSHNLGLEVIAEGVESQYAWNMLNKMGCDYAQGYFMSRPLDKEPFFSLLETDKTVSCCIINSPQTEELDGQ